MELTLGRLLGEGSYGTIYEATGPQGRVALKLLRRDRQTPQMTGRFRREAEALAACGEHPHVVGLVLPVHEREGTLAFAMQYLGGGPLRDSDDVLGVGAALASALAYVHERGFLHRDLSLANLLLDEGGRVFLTDFGLCRPLERSEGSTPSFWFAHGDPEFAAPERLFHVESGAVGDAYALGAVLHRLATRQSLVALGKLSYLYNVYTRQMEQFLRTCIGQNLPCPKIDFGPVYQYYLEQATPVGEDFVVPLSAGQREGLAEVLRDLLEPDYWRRLRRWGTLTAVSERLAELRG